MRFATQASRRFVLFRATLFLFTVIAIFPGTARNLRTTPTLATQRSSTTEVRAKGSPETLRLNTLGVAYMNQGKSADAQKYFEQALAAAPDFAEAKMNLGIALLAQQKLEQAHCARTSCGRAPE